jgi:hypothetical protein
VETCGVKNSSGGTFRVWAAILAVAVEATVAVVLAGRRDRDRADLAIPDVAAPAESAPDGALAAQRAAPSDLEQPIASPATPTPSLRQPQRRTVPAGVGIVQPEGSPPPAAAAAPDRGTSRLPIQRWVDQLDLRADQRAEIARFDAAFGPAAAERLRVGDELVEAAALAMREARATENPALMNEARAAMKQAVQVKMEALDGLSRQYGEGIRVILVAEQAAAMDEFLARPQAPGVEIAVPLEGSGPADPDAPDRRVHGVIPLEGAPAAGHNSDQEAP